MPSELGTRLRDKLIPLVDKINGKVETKLGLRQFRVYLELWEWSGSEPGDGAFSLVSSLELGSDIAGDNLYGGPPEIKDGRIGASDADGTRERGTVVLSGISLEQFKESELLPPTPAANQEWFWRVSEARGQGHADRYYKRRKPPISDWDGAGGWVVELERSAAP